MLDFVSSGIEILIEWFHFLIVHLWNGHLYLAGRIMSIGITVSIVVYGISLLVKFIKDVRHL